MYHSTCHVCPVALVIHVVNLALFQVCVKEEVGYFIMYLNFMRDVTLSTQCHYHSHLLWPNFSKVYIIYYGAKRIDLSHTVYTT